ncbi:MAG: spore coat protein [Armatimonadetes bacterium]|nr:spore coat protein [Armatimonadota bacterium]
MTCGAIVAARTQSSRLPGKALLPLGGKPMIVFLLERLLPVSRATVVFATSHLPEDDELAETVRAAGVAVFRGQRDDVVRRYVDAARHFGFDRVIRVTGDCPFVDAASLERCLDECAAIERFDLATTKRQYPVGIDYEIYDARVMERLDHGDRLDAADREHLTKHFYDHPDDFAIVRLSPPDIWGRSGDHAPLTVDTSDDYQRALRIVEGAPGDLAIDEVLNRARHVRNSGLYNQTIA